jgi:hypothetical protein
MYSSGVIRYDMELSIKFWFYVFIITDHLATVNAYNLWELIFHKNGSEAAYSFCREKYLSHTSLDEIRKLRENFRAYLREAGFVSKEGGVDRHNDDDDEYEVEDEGM